MKNIFISIFTEPAIDYYLLIFLILPKNIYFFNFSLLSPSPPNLWYCWCRNFWLYSLTPLPYATMSQCEKELLWGEILSTCHLFATISLVKLIANFLIKHNFYDIILSMSIVKFDWKFRNKKRGDEVKIFIVGCLWDWDFCWYLLNFNPKFMNRCYSNDYRFHNHQFLWI